MTPLRFGRAWCGLALAAAIAPAAAQSSLPGDSTLIVALKFRSIGPALMSGRITDLAVAENPAPVRGGRLGTVVYVGAATGGVWKTTNAGVSWTSVFDSARGGGIGAVEVAPSNSDVVWVGTGEAGNMRSSSWGTGVYKSVNGGKTWTGPMLPKSQHIGRIVVDPRDPNVVYVAALGPLWAAGGERGLFKTSDGGATWTNTKEISPHTGFTDVAIDPDNPDVLYAASFERERREYGFLPAGPESGIWKTTDGAKTWAKLSRGLPTGDIGRIGLSVCASRPHSVYASVHAKGNTGGIFRTDDGGATWRQVSPTNGTAWYYSFVKCDPTDADHVVRLNAASQESHDGGRTWTAFAAGNGIHSDHHELWIDPANPALMLLGTDGGLYTTYDAGKTWDHNEQLPFSQFYDVFVDDARPFYNVCGGLQDNGAWCGPSQSRNAFGPTNADWYRTAGGDGFYAVPDPNDANIVYAESQGGGVVRYDARLGQSRGIKPSPRAGEKPYRFNWNAPILPSQHTPKVVYMAANFVFRSPDRGDTWVKVSPDLTRAIDRKTLPMRGTVPDSSTLGLNEGTAEFSNITAIDESAFKATLLAAGTDDGIIQVTRDGGKTWTKTEHFDGIPDTTYVSRIIWSRANEGTLYATLDGHRSNDFKPYVLKSGDYGKSWANITGNLPEGSVQVIREHPRTPQLLFVGTEFGVFVSTEGGNTWTPMRGGMPTVPVDDIKIQERWNDLVLGTHGRGVYILDDLVPLEKLAEAKRASATYMFQIADAVLYQPNTSRNSGMGTRGFSGENPPPGPKITYLLRNADTTAKAKLDIVDAAGTVVRELAVPSKAGLYREVWDMRVGPPLTGPVDTAAGGRSAGGRGGRGAAADSAPQTEGGRGGRGNAPAMFTALPGTYLARLTVTPKDGAPAVTSQKFTVTKDPAVTMTLAELQQLNRYRLEVAAFQRTLREQQAQNDTAQRRFAELQRAADSASNVPDAAKKELAAMEKEFRDLTRELGAAPGAGRGGRGGRGGGAGGRGGTGGRGSAGRGGADDNPGDDTQTVQARYGRTTDVMTVFFSPTPEQQVIVKELPTDLQRQADRLAKLVKERLPALDKALRDAGVSVRNP